MQESESKNLTTDDDFPEFIPWDADRRSWPSKLKDAWRQNAAPYKWQFATGKGMSGAGWRRTS